MPHGLKPEEFRGLREGSRDGYVRSYGRCNQTVTFEGITMIETSNLIKRQQT